MKAWIGVVMAGLTTGACGDAPSVHIGSDGDTTFADAEVSYEPNDQFAMLSEDGVVKLGLTSSHIYIQLSEALREYVDREIDESLTESDSRLARSIGSVVRRGVNRAMSIDVAFPVADVRDVDYRNGELVFEWEDPDDRDRLRDVEIDDEPITRVFAEEDARAFVDAFRRVKRGETLRGADDDTPGAGDTTLSGGDTTRRTGDTTRATGAARDAADGGSF